ncbi:hypothetical protein R1flu_022409 [Riccia fluitans]|uniref:Uncharacterized protein n=1 Tax=Riccia fluitans TaxID=41844 RepID=A0ABD1ZT89_9MARC
MDETVDNFEAVYGQARGEIMGKPGVSTHLPFLFSFQSTDLLHLCLSITDFHNQTWRAEFSVDQLQEMRDEVGIGGTWNEFLVYLRAALASDNVKVIFSGPANPVDGHGPASASVVAQKVKGTPRLSLPVSQLEGSHVQDAMASISLGLFRSCHAQSSVISAEKARASVLESSLVAERARVEKLQEQIEASGISYAGRRKGHRERSSQLLSSLNGTQATQPATQSETQVFRPFPTPPFGTLDPSKDMSPVKPPTSKTKCPKHRDLDRGLKVAVWKVDRLCRTIWCGLRFLLPVLVEIHTPYLSVVNTASGTGCRKAFLVHIFSLCHPRIFQLLRNDGCWSHKLGSCVHRRHLVLRMFHSLCRKLGTCTERQRETWTWLQLLALEIQVQTLLEGEELWDLIPKDGKEEEATDTEVDDLTENLQTSCGNGR